MKKYGLLLVMSLYSLCGLAQLSHLTFMGFPMNERLETFMQKLRSMGFVGEYKEDSFGGAILIEMKGSYRGKPVKLTFGMTSKSKMVYEVNMALDKPNVTEAEARETFKIWKQFLVPNPGPLLRLDERRSRNSYTEWLLGQISTEVGTVALYFGYTQKGNIKKDFYVHTSFTDAQTFNRSMSEDWVEIDDGSQAGKNTKTVSTENLGKTQDPKAVDGSKTPYIIADPLFPPDKVIKFISTFTPPIPRESDGGGDENGSNNENGNGRTPIYPPSPKPSDPIPGPVPPPKPHHWGHVKVEEVNEADTTDVLMEINAIDFIRYLFHTNDYNAVRQLILSTPSLSFKKTEEKKDYFVALRTEGEGEEILLRRKDKKSDSIEVLRITVKKWDEEEIIQYLTSMGYHEVSRKEEDFFGTLGITRTYSNGETSHQVKFFFLNSADPIKTVIFERK